uniref:Uncharacterized protein n=1 Tax=Scophthalmus maximus TaxID=52904 RepID=A0A8D2ZPZ7_SCOMX
CHHKHRAHGVKSETKATYSFGDEVEQVDTQADFLLVVTWSEGEGHLVVSGVHHVLVPLCETAGDGQENKITMHFMKLEKNSLPCHTNTTLTSFVPTDLGGDGELSDDDSDGVGVLGQLPGAGQLHHLVVSVGGVGQRGFGVSQALDQGLDLIEVRLLPEQRRLLEVARQRQLGRPQEVEDVAGTAETET